MDHGDGEEDEYTQEDMDTEDPLITGELPPGHSYMAVGARPLKRRRSSSDVSLDSDGLPPHNTDCDCESYSENEGNEDSHSHNPPKKQQKTETETGSVPSLETADHGEVEVDAEVPAQPQRTRREIERERRNYNLRPEILRTLSPRSLHRTLMANINLEEYSFSDDSSSYGGSSRGDFNPTQRSQPRVLEYEVGSISPSRENPNPIEDMTSTTDEELVNTLQRSSSSSSDWSAKEEAERGSFADSSDSESDAASKRSGGVSTDSELSDQDKWFCTQCNAKTNIPYFRYCLRCFNIRRNWLPQRPKGKGKARPPPKPHRLRIRAPYTYPPEEGPLCSTPEQERPNSISSSSGPSTGSTTPSSSSRGAVTKREPIPGPSRELSLKLQSALDAPPVSVALAAGIRDDPLCIICMGREKNAAFVHGKSAHFCCCFSCGDKILKRAGKCPICRRKILKVVKIII